MKKTDSDFSSFLTEEQKKLFEGLPRQMQKEFCIEFVKTNFANQRDSYLSACKKLGKEPAKNPDKAASQLVSSSNVSAFLSCVRAKKENAEILDAIGTFEQKRQMLWDTVQRCAQARPVMVRGEHMIIEDSKGELAAAYTFDSKGIVSAISELNKMDGDHAAQRIELNASDDLIAAVMNGRRRAKNRETDG